MEEVVVPTVTEEEVKNTSWETGTSPGGRLRELEKKGGKRFSA